MGEDPGAGISSPQQKEVNPTFLRLFVLWDQRTPTRLGEGRLLYSIHQFKCSSPLETPFQIHLETMFHWLAGHPSAQAS